MATLTETAYIARRAVKFGGIGFVAILILWWTGTGLITLYMAANPEPPPPPAASFGLLPAVEFPEATVEIASFQLQTPTGQLGIFPDRAKIFVSPSRRSTFLAADTATQLAARIGFPSEPTLETSTLYRWSQVAPLPSTLQMDIINTHFSLLRSWQADPSLITNKRFVNDQQSILDARTFLSSAGLMATDLIGQEKLIYLRAQGDQLIPAISLSEADFVRVDFFRAPFQAASLGTTTDSLSLPFYTADPDRGLVSIIVSGSSEQNKKIIAVDYRYSPIEYESFSDYPLKTVQQAWDELNAGGGFIASFTGANEGIVRRISLGYFDPLTAHEFVMPIYVFVGDNDLVAYVSAIAPQMTEAVTQ